MTFPLRFHDCPGAVLGGLFEGLDAILAQWVDRAGPFEVSRVGPRHIAGVVVGDVEGGELGARPAGPVVGLFEGEEQQLEARLHAVG